MKKVYVYFHTHWDREWYKTRVEFNFRLVEVFDDVLKKLVSNELPCFYFDGQVSALIDYLKFRPENEALIKQLIKEKKLFTGPFYCSTDSFLISVQSMLSNIDLGIKYSKELGCNEFIGYCADTFGHSKSLNEIFKHYNFKAGIFWRGLGNLPSCFDWEGLKSVYLRQGYFHDYLNCDLPYSKKAELIETQLQKIDDKKQKEMLLPLGADHLKVADDVKIQIKEINKHLKNYELIISNPFEYIKKATPTTKAKGEFRDNSRNFILDGVLSSRIDIKQKNTCSEWNLLRIAEPLNALCYNKKLIKTNYQAEIDRAKEELIKNHAHDSIYGCSIDEVHKDMLHRFTQADDTSNCVINEVLNTLETNSDKISVINLSDFEFSGLCEIKTDKKLKNFQLVDKEFYVDRNLSLDINKIPVTEDFKPIYTYLFEAEKIKPFSIQSVEYKKTKTDLKITKNSLENSKIKLEIKNKKINLTDKKTLKTYNNFIEIIDMADVGDSYNFAPVKNDKYIKAELINSKISCKGDLRSVLELDFKIGIPQKSAEKGRSKKIIPHTIKMFVTLDKNSDYLSFNTVWENKSHNHSTKVVFNYESPVSEVVSDDMTGEIKRKFDTDYDLRKHVPAQKGIELKTNTQPLQTYFKTQNTGVITKGLKEYRPFKNTVELTILRSTDIISNPKNPARGTPAGPPIKTPDLEMLKNINTEFAITFNKNVKKVQQAFFGCTLAFFGNVNTSLLKTENELLTATFDKKLLLKTLDKSGKITEI